MFGSAWIQWVRGVFVKAELGRSVNDTANFDRLSIINISRIVNMERKCRQALDH